MSWLASVLVSLIPICVNLIYPGASETERRLHQKLFKDYNMKVRPARHWEERVTVRVGMTLSQLVSLVNTQEALKFLTLSFTYKVICFMKNQCVDKTSHSQHRMRRTVR